MRKIIANTTFDEERALYNIKNTGVQNCTFAGIADGESVLKEGRNYEVIDCSFSLRYPMWHAKKYALINSSMDEKTRAPLWYSDNGRIENCKIDGIKCLRECKNTEISNSTINSPEFGWRCKKVNIFGSKIDSMYFLFEAKDVVIDNLKFTGKKNCFDEFTWLINIIQEYLSDDKIRPLTDFVHVLSPEKISFSIRAKIYLYKDSDETTVLKTIESKMQEYKIQLSEKLGKDVIQTKSMQVYQIFGASLVVIKMVMLVADMLQMEHFM